MKKSLGIIGGNGQMGRAMQAILSAKGWDVHIADLGTKLSNKDVLGQSDIIFFAVPVHCMESVAKDIAADVSDRHILIHVCSIAEAPLEVMQYHCGAAGALYYAHPMFDPSNWHNLPQTLVAQAEFFDDARLDCLIEDLFEGIDFLRADAREHDRMGSFVQAVYQIMQVSLAASFAKMGLNPDLIFDYRAHPKFHALINFTKRLLVQDPALFANIIYGSEQARKNTALFARSFESFANLNARDFFAKWREAKEFYAKNYQQAEKKVQAICKAFPCQKYGADVFVTHELGEFPSTIQTVITLSMASILTQEKIPFEALKNFCPPGSIIVHDLASSILNEKGVLALSEFSLTFFEVMEEILNECTQGGREKFEQHFMRARDFFGIDACADAYELTNKMVAYYKEMA